MSDDTQVLPVFIPFRLREGGEQRRMRNLREAMRWWSANGLLPIIISDEGQGNEQFNRHRAYNIAVAENPDLDVFVFAESDVLVPRGQIMRAVDEAREADGLVVPYARYMYASEKTTDYIAKAVTLMDDDEVGEWLRLPLSDESSIFHMRFDRVTKNRSHTRAVNVVSRNTLKTTGGYTELISGLHYNEAIIDEVFAALTRATRFVPGSAVHLFHTHDGEAEDLMDVAANRGLLISMRRKIRAKDRYGIRKIMSHRIEQESADV
jgi:hypothetical protein